MSTCNVCVDLDDSNLIPVVRQELLTHLVLLEHFGYDRST